MKKIFAFFAAALMSVSMFALTPNDGDVWDDATKTLTVNSNPGEEAYMAQTEILHVIVSDAVTSIGVSAFDGCTELISATIGNKVVSLEEYAFYNCASLNSVTIGSSVTSIGRYAFYGCTGLNFIEIPNSVETIKQGAFYGCTGLTSLTIGNKVTTCEAYSFENCTGLTSVTIPQSVTEIGVYAFKGCSGLLSITCEAVNPPTLGSQVFKDVSKSIPLYVPRESIEAYKGADQWNAFGDNIKAIGSATGIDNVQGDGEQNIKALHNGQLYILRNGKLFNATGAEVK